MNRERAKQILLNHRPGLDEPGAEENEALALLAQDQELRRWFERQQSTHAALRAQFRSLRPPAGFKEQIISERPWHTRPLGARQVLAVAAAVVVLTVAGFWWTHRPRVEETSFAAYRSQLVATAQSAYAMDITTNDPARIKAFFQERGAPAEFDLPDGLKQAAGLGCKVFGWQSQMVGMICYRTGRPLPPGQASDLWFFVIDGSILPDAPKSSTPQFASVSNVAMASWTNGGKLYVLAVQGDTETLKKYL